MHFIAKEPRYALSYTTASAGPQGDPAQPGSGAAKRLPDALGGLRCLGIGFESLAEPIRLREHLRHPGKGLEILALDGSLDDLFDAMIARNDRRIGLTHRRRAGVRIQWISRPRATWSFPTIGMLFSD